MPAGDQLYHFVADSTTKPGEKYYVAVHYIYDGLAGGIRSTCQCWDAFSRFPQDRCKHQIEAIEFMLQEMAVPK